MPFTVPQGQSSPAASLPSYGEPLDFSVQKLSLLWKKHEWRVREVVNGKALVGAETPAEEFFFCLLGGYGITYEANLACFLYLREKGVFKREWFKSRKEPKVDLAKLLSEARLQNSAEDIKTFRYRFPNKKSVVLCDAASWLETTMFWDFEWIRRVRPHEAREVLIGCPGVGYKTASWFLRNAGAGAGLAIVDIHIERICKEWAVVPFGLSAEKNYLEIEQRLAAVCRRIPAPIEAMDLILWQYSRGDLR